MPRIAAAARRARIDSGGYSLWITPRAPLGAVPVAPPAGVVRASLEGLFRFDRRRPNQTTTASRTGGSPAWRTGPRCAWPASALRFLLDYELVRYRRFAPPPPDEKRLAVHMLVNF